MSINTDPGYEILSEGDLVILRTPVKEDRQHYLRWQTQGEWRAYDAPWEQPGHEENQTKEEKKPQAVRPDDSGPQKMAVITTLENQPLGWVNRYAPRNNPLVWAVGIDICEDAYLNRGCGTEALTLWVNYLFNHSNYHKLCLDTWSFNPRMVRVAEKIGFIAEGCQREMQLWQGEWLDLLHFGLLREEWETGASSSQPGPFPK
jgi:RimJ/RimL family protein N-acetyltransferase